MSIFKSDLMNNANRAAANSHDSLEKLISPVVFDTPLLFPPSAWTEHIPFAYWLIEYLKPTVVVELGTHYGLSYFSFCQAIQKNLPGTKCFAVDNWTGDEHAGFYDESVFEFVSKKNVPFNNFSTLLRTTFDQAIVTFADNSIDLLHIDGLHTYDAVKHDFDCWLPKISEKGIVLFHDTNVLERGFGVYKLWEELILQYPFFEFKHGFGLGILGVGKKLPEHVKEFFNFSAKAENQKLIRKVYARLGNLTRIEQEFKLLKMDTEHEMNANGIPAILLPGAKKPVNYLRPLTSLNIQVFWKKAGEEFIEENSAIQTIQLNDSRYDHLFKLDQDFSAIQKIRVDPSTEAGIFYLHAVSIVNNSGSILINWDIIRKNSAYHNLVALKSSLLENSFLFISLTDDPIIEIDLPAMELNENNLSLRICVSRLDSSSLDREFFNITDSELNGVPSSENISTLSAVSNEANKDFFSNRISEAFYQFKIEYLDRQERLEKEKNELIIALKDQNNQFNNLINQLYQTILEKEVLITFHSETLHLNKINEHQLKEKLQILEDEKENANQTLTLLEISKKEDDRTADEKINNLRKDLEDRKRSIEELQKIVNWYKDMYENNTIFGMIKNRIFKANK